MATIDMKTLKFENDENTYKVVDGDAVHISAQILSDIEKTQVLNNIGAAAAGHSHTLSSLGAAAASHTHDTTEIDYTITGITSDTLAANLPKGVSIFPIGNDTSLGFPITYGILATIKESSDRGFSIVAGKGNNQQMYFRGLQSSTNTEWNKIYTGSDVRYSTTQPTANLSKGQIWLKPI